MSELGDSASPWRRWNRVAALSLAFTLIASAVGCCMFFAEWIVTGLSNSRYHVSIGSLPMVAGQAVMATGIIGVPIALATGVIFALMAELMGLRQMWCAVLATMIVLMFAQFLPAMIFVWQMETYWLMHILVYLILPAIVSWLILHRWTVLLRA